MASKTRTILRIKRRRTEEPLPYIRLEGLDGRMKRPRGTSIELDSANISELLDNAELEKSNGGNRSSSSVLWKRLTPKQDEKQKYRIVDAMLEEDGRMTKRRKLTLLETSSETDCPLVVSVRRKTPLRVLDPLSRLADDSLQEVHAGTKRISEHFHFVTTDRRLAHDSSKWLAWCHSSSGNILHACALWNDVEVASEVLQLPFGAPLTEQVDGDGRTPYEVAQLSGHDSVCEVLEAFGGDTTNFVYDIFCLEEESETDGKYEEQQMTCELTSGVGYWTPDGELILEAPEKSSASLNHVFDEDGEIDSNCEEYGGNDYPEEEDWEDDCLLDQGYKESHNFEMCSEEVDYNDLVNGIYGATLY